MESTVFVGMNKDVFLLRNNEYYKLKYMNWTMSVQLFLHVQGAPEE